MSEFLTDRLEDTSLDARLSILIAVCVIIVLGLSGCAMTMVAGDNNGQLKQSVTVTSHPPKHHAHTGLDRAGLDEKFRRIEAGEQP